MSALHDALLHPNNRPRALCEWLAGSVNSGAELRGLTDGGGLICDFRPGFEEHNPSLSVSVGNGGTVFNRHGGDRIGGALDFTASCLKVDKGEAARLLIERAGIVDTGPTDRARPTAKASRGAASLLSKLDKLKPLDEAEGTKRLRGWVKLTGEDEGAEVGELARRGLTPALTAGLLTAYRFTGREQQDPAKPSKVVSLPGRILPGAVLFEVTGPDAQPWSLKLRNPGEGSELKAAKATRYTYLSAGQGTPAWCSPGLTGAASEVWVEGELSGVAVAVMLEAAGYGGAVGVQGVAGSEALPHVSHLTAGREVYIYADGDKAGDKARQTWAALAAHLGAVVYQIGQDGGLFSFRPGGDSGEYKMDADACDALGHVGKFGTPQDRAAYLGAKLMKAMQDAPQWTPPEVTPEGEGIVWTGKKSGYKIQGGRLCAFTVKEEDGEEFESVEVLCEFSAHITAEVTLEDGTGETGRVFELEGRRPDGRPMNPPRVNVSAADFAAMNWPVALWGASAIVRAGNGKKDKAREAILQLSSAAGIEERTVYQHTGWTQHPEKGPLYLSALAVIGAAGAVAGVDVELSGRLAAYALPDPGEGTDMVGAVRASLALLDLAPDSVAVPLLGAVYRAPLGRLDAALWGVGATGMNKTAYFALAQSHYGALWTRQHLPDGWNSSANALERSAFMVKDAVFLIDDFKPSGSAADTARAQGNVARILQGVADGQGRATLTAERRSRAGLYPRGTVLSSAEDLPRGHSNRARAVVVKIDHRLIDTPEKSAAYYAAEDLAGRGVYALALSGYVQLLAGHLADVQVGSPAHRARTRQLAPRFEGQHGRTGPAAAELAYGWEVFLSYAVRIRAVSEGEAAALWGRVLSALEDTAEGQAEHLQDEDPVSRALSILSELLAQGRVYLEDKDMGGPPEDAEFYGWQAETSQAETSYGEDSVTRYQHRNTAEHIGWMTRSGGDVWAYFMPEALHGVLQRAVTAQGGAILPPSSTLYANMRGLLHPQGRMKCEAITKGGAVTGHRNFSKATVYGRPNSARFTVLRLPLDGVYAERGKTGKVGKYGEETASDTADSRFPLTNYFSLVNGKTGKVGPFPLSVSPFAAVPETVASVLEEDAWAVTL